MLINSCQNCPRVSKKSEQDKNNKNHVIMKKKRKKRKKKNQKPALTYENQPTKKENNKAVKKLLSFRVPEFLLLQ